MNAQNVTDKDIEQMQIKIRAWLGSDNETPEDYSELLAQIATGGYPVAEFIKDVTEYGGEI